MLGLMSLHLHLVLAKGGGEQLQQITSQITPRVQLCLFWDFDVRVMSDEKDPSCHVCHPAEPAE